MHRQSGEGELIGSEASGIDEPTLEELVLRVIEQLPETPNPEAILAIDAIRNRFDQLQHRVEELQNENSELVHNSIHDPLTGIYNRAGFFGASESLINSLTPGQSIVVSFADMDNFKPVNDAIGHHVGDELLRQVAGKLQEKSGPNDVVGRFDGDEFAILHVIEPGSVYNANDLAMTLREGIASIADDDSAPWVNVGVEITIGQSDVYTFPFTGVVTIGDMLIDSDKRMNAAKPNIRRRS
jgi:diguanylate cyclase (GGDEF)-like protein